MVNGVKPLLKKKTKNNKYILCTLLLPAAENIFVLERVSWNDFVTLVLSSVSLFFPHVTWC